jgi:hypothetical protein
MRTDQIDKKNMEIKQVEDTVYTNVQDVGDELPDNTPRYILLSYPLTLVCLLSVCCFRFFQTGGLESLRAGGFML